MGKILGIDYGTKYVGLALTDSMHIMASPYKTLSMNTEVYENLCQIIRKERVECIVVGLPISMDGTLHAQANEVLEFIEIVRTYTDVRIETMDERFTTQMANDALQHVREDRRKKKQILDQLAAVRIVERFLPRYKNMKNDVQHTTE